jgi:phosphatidate cytidylyltransferase
MNFIKQKSELYQRILTALFLGSVCLGIFFMAPSIVFSLLIGAVVMYCALYELPKLINYQTLFFWVVLLGYIVLPAFCLMVLNQSPNRIFLLFLLCAVWSFDSGAYFVGKKWGKHKLAPKISPKKSWEGVVGGFVCVFLMLYFLFTFFEFSLQNSFLLILSIIICLSATAGDLFESWLKRQAAVKDAGSLLPGHGGVLDRIDSILGAAPVWYLFSIKYFYLINAG